MDHYENKCVQCGFDNINALEVHHIDKNRSNNELDNLIILCANCHSILHRTTGEITEELKLKRKIKWKTYY